MATLAQIVEMDAGQADRELELRMGLYVAKQDGGLGYGSKEGETLVRKLTDEALERWVRRVGDRMFEGTPGLEPLAAFLKHESYHRNHEREKAEELKRDLARFGR